MKADIYGLNEIKHTLLKAELRTNQLTVDMNQRINQDWSVKERQYVDACYAYQRYRSELIIKPEKIEALNKIEEKAQKYVRELLDENNSELTLDQLMIRVYEFAGDKLQEIEDYKTNLKRAMCNYAYHASPVPELSELVASKLKENMYCNEVSNSVYAVTDYNQLILYMGRAVAGEMHVLHNGDICIYPSNPVLTTSDEHIVFKNNIYLYRVAIEDFEPVIDYVLNDNTARILFGHEWISQKEKVQCEGSYLNKIPLEDWNKHCYFYFGDAIDTIAYIDICREKRDIHELWNLLSDLTEQEILIRIS